MRSFLLLILLLGAIGASPACAQRISRIDFDSVRTETSKAGSRYYFPNLLSRFQAADTTLTRQDYSYLYYGQVFTAQYAPYGGGKQDDFRALYNKQQYAEAIPLGEKLLAAAPLDLNMLFKLLVCYHMLGDRAHAKQYARRYYSLLNAIVNSGDGQSTATAYVVAVVHDEYEVLKEQHLSSSRQALVGHTDVLTATPIDDNGKPTGEKAREVYFDVTQSLAALARDFKGKK
jgi:tetratricopeptide (TPR) repeat protein